MGRPRLSSPERRRRILASKAKWRDAHREYYRAQINQLSSRPEYKARRKELRAMAKARKLLGVPEVTPEPVSPMSRETPSHTSVDASEPDPLYNAPTAHVDAF